MTVAQHPESGTCGDPQWRGIITVGCSLCLHVSQPVAVAAVGRLSELIGDYDHETVSYSINKGVRSTNVQNNRRRILDTSELAELHFGRAILLASGLPSSMMPTAPWYEGADADKLKASIAAHEAGEQVERIASKSTPTATVPAEGNPSLNASTVQPLETEDGR